MSVDRCGNNNNNNNDNGKKQQQKCKKNDDLDMCSLINYEKRLNTFNDIKLIINKQDLAAAGFYLYIKEICYVKIKCIYCNYQCALFENSLLNNNYESPFDEHKQQSSNCFIFKSIEEEREQHAKKSSIGMCESNGVDRQSFSSDEGCDMTTSPLSISMTNNNNLIHYDVNTGTDQLTDLLQQNSNSICNDKPYHPGFATEISRLESFKNWPTSVSQQPVDLAKAGFYYYGTKDIVKCFYCNGNVYNWTVNEEPLSEHARWFPKCAYMRQLMGDKYIEEIKERFRDMDSGFNDDDSNQNTKVNNNNNNNNNYDEPPCFKYDRSISGTGSIGSASNSVGGDDSFLNERPFRPASPRTINSRLDLNGVRKVIELGFKRSIVRKVIENKLNQDGKDFNSLVELVKSCIKFEEENNNDGDHDDNDDDDDDETTTINMAVGGCNVYTSSPKKDESLESCSLFHLTIKNLPSNVSEFDIYELFEKRFKAKPIEIKHISDNGDLDNDNIKCSTINLRFNKYDVSNLELMVNELNGKPYPTLNNEINNNNNNDDNDNNNCKENNKLTVKILTINNNNNDNLKTSNEEKQPICVSNDSDYDIKKEVEKLKYERQCVICIDRIRNILFLPCSHLASCVECSMSLQTCPICRTRVQATIRTYSS